jgi:hypothetical protein
MAREEEGFFDELARGLADGSVTRGKALRLMGAALVGSALGSVGIGGEASADPPGCKRNGKTCTRDEQCCSGNCASGSCQAQTTTTTTTTPTTTTSTTTPTTSTSTSTTSTSTTTPMCLQNFSTPCTADTQCCSGVCGFQGPGPNTFCVASRPPGAICTADTQCLDVSSGIRACVNGRCCTTGPCNDTTPCCPGSGCVNGVCRS